MFVTLKNPCKRIKQFQMYLNYVRDSSSLNLARESIHLLHQVITEHQKAFHYDVSKMNCSLRCSDIRFRCSRRTKKLFLQKKVIKNGKETREEVLTLVPPPKKNSA